jgi:hypothetical protein
MWEKQKQKQKDKNNFVRDYANQVKVLFSAWNDFEYFKKKKKKKMWPAL